MSAVLTARCHRLADSLAELKVRVRAALATELAAAVGAAVRDIVVVALLDRLCVPHRPTPARLPPPRAADWRDDPDDRDEWGYTRDPWSDPDDDSDCDRTPSRYAVGHETHEPEPTVAVPVAAAVAVGVNVGRWWLARKGTVAAAVGVGVLATTLGLAGGPVARAALAVLAAATDVLTAESALSRTDS